MAWPFKDFYLLMQAAQQDTNAAAKPDWYRRYERMLRENDDTR